MFTTSGTYPWSFVTQIFHNGQPSHGGDRKIFELMTSIILVTSKFSFILFRYRRKKCNLCTSVTCVRGVKIARKYIA